MTQLTPDWLPESELGSRFVDVRLLTSGSRCTVYHARDRDTGRHVAVKVPAGDAARWLHDSLNREGTLLAQVCGHPSVVTLHERYRLDDGRPALVMDYAPNTLEDTVHGTGQLPVESIVAIGVRLAGALETVHRAGAVHCDVRPANVLLGAAGEPLLAGFDEAVAVDAGAGRPPMHLTTPHTAPELLEGEPATPAADVYGLASTLYEATTGRAAFRAYVGESPAQVVVRVLSGSVRPIVSAQVPIELSDTITWAMRHDPAARPPSAVWFAEELSRIERREGWARTRAITF